MDPTQQQPVIPSPPHDDLSDELAHINQEMYRRNAELAEKNRTLSLLRKIDDVIRKISADTATMAAQVTNLLIQEGGYKISSICLRDDEEKKLKRISLSESDIVRLNRGNETDTPYIVDIPLSIETNILVKAFNQQTVQITNNIIDMMLYPLEEAALTKLQEATGMKSFLVFPLIVRSEVLGTMSIGLSELEKDLSPAQRDLLYRLAEVVGIAMDNNLLYTKVDSANQKLKALDKLKDEFVSLASHELRTPMTAIKSYLWMALAGKGGALTEKQKYYLDRSYKSTERLINLVNDMLNVSRIESGRIILQLQNLDMKTVISDVMTELMPHANELGVSLVSQIPETPLPLIVGDPDKIKQVMINLIGNSFKFTPQGGKITLSLSQKDNMIETVVTDTGTGIAKEDLPKLFHKFGMVGNSYLTKQNSQGTGLGLYISKAIVELHGGSMHAFSEGLGKGTSFSFSLKLAPPASSTPEIFPSPSSLPSTEAGQPMNVPTAAPITPLPQAVPSEPASLPPMPELASPVPSAPLVGTPPVQPPISVQPVEEKPLLV